ncbi:MAG: sugar phosphate isomerase/epimerase family protein [Planctomycetota bacterium]
MKTNHTQDKQTPPISPSNRRSFLAASVAACGAATLAASTQAASSDNDSGGKSAPEFRYCLNTSTINGSAVPISDQIKIAAKAGYDSLEIWLRDVGKFTNGGGKIKELKAEIDDLGLGIDSAIAFGNWIVDDEEKRKSGLENCKRDMEIVAALGGTRIAAPPTGATREAGLDLNAAGDRYAALLEVGKQTGVLPQVELWGFSKNLSKLEEVLYVAAAANHPDACILLDVYHLYKGGSDFSNIGLIPGHKMHCLHMNDYPDMPRDKINDADRVYPGDGVAPMDHILQTLVAGGFAGTLSLELFNRDYYKLPPQEVANTGLEKMKQCVARALA